MGIHFSPLGCIFPVPCPLDLRGNRRGIHWYHPGLDHARQGDLLSHFAVGAGGINNRKHFITLRDCANRGKRHADAGDGAGNDQRFAPGGVHRSHKLRVIPGVDLTFTWNVLRMWRISVDLRDKGAIRSLRNRSGGDHRDLRQGSDFCQRRSTCAQLWHWHIPHGLEKSALVIDKQHHRIVYINNRA